MPKMMDDSEMIGGPRKLTWLMSLTADLATRGKRMNRMQVIARKNEYRTMSRIWCLFVSWSCCLCWMT